MSKKHATIGSRRIVLKRVSIDVVEYAPEHVVIDIDFPLGFRVSHLPGTGRLRVTLEAQRHEEELRDT